MVGVGAHDNPQNIRKISVNESLLQWEKVAP